MAFIVVVRVLFLSPLYLTKIFCSLAARLLFFITIGCNSKFVSCQIPQLKTNQRRAQNKDERRQKKNFSLVFLLLLSISCCSRSLFFSRSTFFDYSLLSSLSSPVVLLSSFFLAPPKSLSNKFFFSFLQNSDHSLCPPASPRFSHQILFFQQTFLLSPLFSSAHFYYHNYNQSFGTRTHPIHPQSFDTTHI